MSFKGPLRAIAVDDFRLRAVALLADVILGSRTL